MITTAQRAFLRKLANALDPVFQVGKGDIGETLVAAVDAVLEKRELIKLSVLETAGLAAKEAAEQLAERTNADVVQCIGRRFVLYRESRKHKRIEV